MKERKLTDYEKSKAEKAFCFYHCKGFRDTKRCFCDSKCKDAQEFIQFLDYIVVKTKEVRRYERTGAFEKFCGSQTMR